MDNNKKRAIKRAAIISVLVLLIVIVGFIMIRYEIEGETNMPFKLSKIMIVSTADGISQEDQKIRVNQCNDFYLSFEKDENTSGIIKNIYIENIKVMSEPEKGTVKFYRPATSGKVVYEYDEKFEITDSIAYEGDIQTSYYNLTVSNQGGTITFRTCVEGIGEIEIDPDAKEKAISYNNDGTLLQKIEIELSQIRYNLGFDVIIELADGKMYKGYINETLPIV